MDLSSIQFPNGRETLSRVIRDIRRLRNLRASDVAERMGLPQRSYELFEAGGGRLDLERLFAFAEATDSDPFAIMLSVPFGSSDFAVACADTKLALIMMMHLQDFYEERGGDITYLDPPNIIGGFERVFKELGGKLDDTEAFLRRWFNGRQGSSISLGTLSVRGLRRRKA
ncbi:helix-turn-helix transcriptional regulator [Sphingobium aquiterrae]|uniref:helix-turn-helix domain-containing protein n=1 Tax=Sphingobium aquiterrae TaxID=2038656 RepID=UPI00301B40C1|tara:strand:+ start:14408 stop:14917 length:510 start_codon:yes stop_codon:yes gene_type:complete